MPGYPYGAGPWPPPQAPQQPPPQQLPQYPPYDYHIPNHQPSVYGGNAYQTAPPNPPPPQVYFSASQAAFQYNSNFIPGLGVTTPTPAYEAPVAKPPTADWHQPPRAAPTEPPYPQRSNEPAALPQYAATGSFLEQFRNEQSPTEEQTLYSPPSAAKTRGDTGVSHPPPPPHSAAHSATHSATGAIGKSREEDELEEGELSESDSDVMYHPAAATQASSELNAQNLNGAPEEASKRLSLEPSVALGQGTMELPSRDASVIDLQEDAFYDEEDGEEPGEVKSTVSDADADDEDMGFSDSEQRATPQVQERGMSYSPRLSPGEIEDNTSDNMNGAASKPAANGISLQQDAASAASGVPAGEPVPNGEPRQPSQTAEARPNNGLPFATVEDAKKEAQRAILKLMPYGVSYQTYIDEGFNEKTIRTLFAELGLKTAAATPVVDSPQSPPTQTAGEVAEPSAPEEPGKKQEERKDRIARLLAMRASKPTPAKPEKPEKPAKPAPQASDTAAKQAKPEKTKSEKERLLQQKLDALKRMQGKRLAADPQVAHDTSGDARGNAKPASQLPSQEIQVVPSIAGQTPQNSAKTPPPTAMPNLHVSSMSQTSTPPSLLPHPSSSLPPRPTTATAIATEAAIETATTATIATSQATSLPAALLPPKPHTGAQPTLGQRKRPVASDFDDFSAVPPNPLKRPFGQMRQESSLVINVSDESDDDIEMEVDSQNDEPPTKPSQARNTSRNGASFRDFAPLSESPFALRHFSHQSAASTPPNGTANGLANAKDDEYARKMRQIEEMKRKIAEAEAKKSRSSRAGTQSPKTGDSTPPDADVSSKTPSRRVVSAGAVAEAGEFVAAVSARLPKPSDNRESRRQLRDRLVSQQIPKVEAGLKEKMFKLKLLQDKVAALQAEIDAGLAEKQRLAKEVDGLAPESPEATPQPEPVSTTLETGASDDAEKASAEAAAANLVNATPSDPLVLETPAMPSTVEDKDDVSPSGTAATVSVPPDTSMQTSEEPTPILNMSPLDHDTNGTGDQGESPDQASSDIEPQPEPQPMVLQGEDASIESDGMDPKSDKSADSPSEPAPEDAPEEDAPEEDEEDDDIVMEDAAVLAQEPAAQPSEADAGQPGTNAGIAPAPAPAPAPKAASSTFTPYESPLRYFRSYRFHPQYRSQVEGGLKSLTFSGSVNPEVELCPYELDGHACSDEPCPFQHIASMVPQDDKILVELGRSDDFIGDRKSEFVNGLREVLKRFRDAKIRDFDKIAYEIIDFRRKFLGDESRILSHLEDVAI